MSREQKVVRRLIESIRFSIAHSLFHSLFFTCSCHFLFLPSFLTTNELGVNAPVVVVYLRKAARNLHATSHLSAFVCSFESAPPEIQSEGKVPLSPWPLPCQEFQPRSTFFPTGWARPALQLVVAALRPFSAKFSRRGQIGATIKNWNAQWLATNLPGEAAVKRATCAEIRAHPILLGGEHVAHTRICLRVARFTREWASLFRFVASQSCERSSRTGEIERLNPRSIPNYWPRVRQSFQGNSCSPFALVAGEKPIVLSF